MKDRHINESLSLLCSTILAANCPENIYGQLAYHFCNADSRLPVSWNVHCDGNWLENNYDPANIGSVATLSYTVDALNKREWAGKLSEGLKRAASRDASFSSSFSPIHDSSVMVGLVLGGKYLSESSNEYIAWLTNIVSKLKNEKPILLKDAGFLYALYLLGILEKNLYIDDDSSLPQLSFCDFILKVDASYSINTTDEYLKNRIVELALSESLESIAAYHSALIWKSLKDSISELSSIKINNASTVVHVLNQFESALKRWRYDSDSLKNPIKWEITSEREVQDILWLILRSYWVDIKDEEAMPKFGHSTYNVDFAIPSLKLLIEAKYARKATDFKQLEKEILEDLIPYLNSSYDKIIVFIYDSSASVQHHEETRQALCSVDGIFDVIIASKPSQLP